MTEISQKAIEGILTTINNGLDKAPDYVVELVHRYSMFYGISNMVGAFLGLLAIIISIWIFKKYQKWYDKDIDGAMIPFGIVVCLGGIITIILCTIECLKGFLVPEVILLHGF